MSLIPKYGVTDAGFVLPRLEDIASDLTTAYTGQYGSDIDTSPDSFFGQKIGIEAKALTDLWELAQAVYYSQYPHTATGASLSNVVQLTGIVRKQATKSTCNVAFFGMNSAVIPTGTTVATSTTGDLFQVTAVNAVLGTGSVMYLEVTACIVGDSMTITLNGTPLECYLPNGFGLNDTVNFANYFSAGLGSAMPGFTVSQVCGRNGQNNTIKIASNDGLPFEFSIVPDTAVINVGTEIPVQALSFGAIGAETGVISLVLNPLYGLDSVYNFEIAAIGNPVETDDALRLRQQQSLQISGGGTAAAIRARILNDVPGVTDVLVKENDTDGPDTNSLPAHSMMAVVTGGDDTAVAEMIWNVKAAGIATYGGTAPALRAMTITDSQGGSHVINFARPADIPIQVEVTITPLVGDDAESLPADAVNQIQQSILAYGATLKTGDYVIAGRFFGPVYTVPGIDTVMVRIRPRDNADWALDVISIPMLSSQRATFAATDILVNGVPTE